MPFFLNYFYNFVSSKFLNFRVMRIKTFIEELPSVGKNSIETGVHSVDIKNAITVTTSVFTQQNKQMLATTVLLKD